MYVFFPKVTRFGIDRFFRVYQGTHNFLGPNSSTTLNVTQEGWFIFYGSGDVAGFLAYDDIALAGFTLKGHKFGVAMNESSEFTP